MPINALHDTLLEFGETIHKGRTAMEQMNKGETATESHYCTGKSTEPKKSPWGQRNRS